jgi:hypothetical protein
MILKEIYFGYSIDLIILKYIKRIKAITKHYKRIRYREFMQI